MNRELEDKLKADFPKIFVHLRDGESREPIRFFGFECGDGWYDLIHNLCDSITEVGFPEGFMAMQVKEKFGSLRFYCCNSTPEINALIDKAEEASYHICESCGAQENVTCEGRPHWVKALCEECAKVTT